MDIDNLWTPRTDTAAASLVHIDAVTSDKVTGWVERGAEAILEEGLVVKIGGQKYATFFAEVIAPDDGSGAKRRHFELPLPKLRFDKESRSLVEVVLASTGELVSNRSCYPIRSGPAPRALVLMPAGARYEHDNVRLRDWPLEKVIDTYQNIGDLMVYDSTLKLLEFCEIEVANSRVINQKNIDRYNAEFDFAFLRGSNYIHASMDWKHAGELIEKLKIPVFAIGVGAQAVEPEQITLPGDGIRIWSAIADHCGTIGVRGSYSAEVLSAHGIKNVEVIGCPSMYRSRSPQLELKRKNQYDVRKIAFSLRRESGAGYARDVGSYRTTQRDFMLRLNRESEMTISIHGEPEEKAFYFRDTARMAKAEETLRESGWITPENETEMLTIYKSQLFFNTTVSRFDEFIRAMDLAIGYRVHAVLPALASGVPGILVGYDTRTSELAEAHSIPIFSENEIAGRSWRDLYQPELFDSFAKSFPNGYRRMKRFLVRNGVPNRM